MWHKGRLEGCAILLRVAMCDRLYRGGGLPMGIHRDASLFSPTRCSPGRSNGGIHRGDSGPLGPVLCRMLDMDLREHLFHALG